MDEVARDQGIGVANIAVMPWWAPSGGPLGPFAGLTITANILMSLLIDQFGLFGMAQHSLNVWRIPGGASMAAGIVLIAAF